MTPHSFPLANHLVMKTNDAELARDRLLSVYGATRFDAPFGGRDFSARASHLQIDGVGLSYCEYARGASLAFEESSYVRQIFNMSGSVRYSAGDRGEIAGGESTGVLRSGAPATFDFSADYRQLVLRIEQMMLRRYLGALLGQEISRDLVFEKPENGLSGRRRARRLVFQFVSDFADLAHALSPLATAELTRGLVTNFLLYNIHDYSRVLFRTPPSSDLSVTRRVEEFIEANWDVPIDIEQLAAVGRVSVRTLFRQFKNDRGYSPADFARSVRLDHARNMLRSGSRHTSVIEVALKCGFQSSGHFAREYRLAFGELPSRTLRRV